MRQVLDSRFRREARPDAIHESDKLGLRYPAQNSANCFFVTSTYKDWTPIGETDGFYEALAESLNFYSVKYNAKISGYVLMPTHIHLVIFIDGQELGNFMRDFKRFIGQKIRRELKIGLAGIWMSRYDRVELNTEKVLREKLEYIHNNPVKSGLVGFPNGWYWSSASDYSGRDSGPVTVWKEWG